MDEEIKKEDVVSQEEPKEVKSDDRPDENYKAELARKNALIQDLQIKLATAPRVEAPRRDANDMNTWGDHELKAVLHTNDPQYAQARDQAQEILLDRKVDAKLQKRVEVEKRVTADLQLKQQYPEAFDPSSELATKMDELTTQYDLSKTPAGRLVAARLAQAELEKGRSSSNAKGQSAEANRRRDVKSNMVDGDRPKPTENPNADLDKRRKELADGLMDTKNEARQVDAVSQLLKDRGFSREKFFGR